MSCSWQTSLLTVPSSVSARAEGTLSLRWPNTGASPSACGEEGRSVPPCDDRRSVVRGTLGWRTGGGRCRLALYPPEEVAGRDGPLAPVVRDVVAEAGGVAMRAVVPADGIHGRGVGPDEAGHLQDHSLDSSHTVDHPVSRRHPAVRERVNRGPEALQPVQDGGLGIPPLQREVVV